MRDDTPTYAAEEARHTASLPEWRDLPGLDELDHTPSSAPLSDEWGAHLQEALRTVADLGSAR